MAASERSRKTGRIWRYSAGEKGRNRVRVFDRGARGIYCDYQFNGKRIREPLNTTDRERAKELAERIATSLRSREPRPSERLSLEKLFDMYEAEVTPGKSASKRAHDRRAHSLFLAFFGRGRDPVSLSRRDWDRFVAARRCGTIRPAGAIGQRAVGNRIIEYDLKQLLAVMNWATVASDESGQRLLAENPLRGFPIPTERNPKRAVMPDELFQEALAIAPRVHSTLPGMLTVARETGHRIGSIRLLRWSDVDLEGGRVTWRAENDKEGRTHTTPLSKNALEAFRSVRRAQAFSRSEWVFPSPQDATKPCSRHIVRDWWERMAKLAKLPTGQRLGWHALRRAFATSLRDASPRELQDLGGWKSYRTPMEHYIQPDLAAQREAMERRRPVRLEDLGSSVRRA